MNSFIFNGKSTTEMGVSVLQLPPYILSEERVEDIQVHGRSGTLTMRQGIDVCNAITLTARCWMKDLTKADAVGAWLHGGGWVTFSDRPEGYYKARIGNQISIDRIVRGSPDREFVVHFKCQPHMYLHNEHIEVGVSGHTFQGKGNMNALPKLRFVGKGHVTLMVNTYITQLAFPQTEEYIEIDSDLMECYTAWEPTNPISRNHIMSGDFPQLVPGLNSIRWTGEVRNVNLDVNWRKR